MLHLVPLLVILFSLSTESMAASVDSVPTFVVGDQNGNFTPSGDIPARAGNQKITDGISVVSVKPGGSSATQTDPALVVTLSPNSSIYQLPSTNSKFSFGDVTTASMTQAPVERTTYTEVLVNSMMSIASSSLSDTAAGIGARTVIITYLDATGAGPNTTTVTLSATAFVNTSVSNLCFIEKIVVATVGSSGANVGVLTLKSAIAGGGTTIGSVAATDNQTFWAHHYVPTGKTTYISGLAASSTATANGNGDLFLLKATQIGVANTPEIQVSDFFRLFGQSSNTQRNYQSPIQVTGPARIRGYVTPESGTNYVHRFSFDYIDN